MASENDLLSGYEGQFLGINRPHLHNPGDFLGLNGNFQLPGPNSYPTAVLIDQIPPLVSVSRSSVGLRDCSMDFGSQKLFKPIPLMAGNRALCVNVNSSDEDDRSFEEDGSGGAIGKQDKDSPWQRMKWTDQVVRILIQVVSNVGEDVSVDGFDGGRQKSGIFKKGKWKTVSSILISKGYQASPQQCEDKFNDLNKRYKKLNDILGRSISCKLVENPGLLEQMTHISPKTKEVAKKLLSSKHLFYMEMSAYHNGVQIPHCNNGEIQIPSAGKNRSDDSLSPSRDKDGCKGKDVSDSEDEDASEEDLSDDVSEYGILDSEGKAGNGKVRFSTRLENLQCDMTNIFNDPTKSKNEQKEWIRKRMLELEKERIEIQAEALELGKRRVKWQKFCDKKESEMEMARLEKERLMLENERETLKLKKHAIIGGKNQ